MTRHIIKLSQEAVDALDASRREFVARFGREPGPNDPVLWDRDAPGDTPVAMTMEKIEAEIRDVARRVGLDPEEAVALAHEGRLGELLR